MMNESVVAVTTGPNRGRGARLGQGRAVIAAALVCLLAGAAAWGQEAESRWPMSDPLAERVEGAALEPTWGTSTDHYLWVSSAAFEPTSSLTPYDSDELGYRWRAGAGGDSYMVAPVNLPSGASVTGLRLYYYDADAVERTVGYFVYWGGTPIAPMSWGTNGADSGAANAAGYGAADVAFTHTVANAERAYVAEVFLGSASNSVRFKGVRLTYRLQVSAAPGVASFADVPTSHMFFQYVEALVASGITAGCGGGNYCPNDPVTRGQMAVFLSKALGLHWQ
jgi:hypothetical protein